MGKYLGFVAVLVFLLSCADDTRDNPYDELAVNYIRSASAEDSSSSVEAGEPSSSSSEAESSSSVVLSSSSVEPSSSSSELSSSSEAESSSSVAPSSSSVEPSSSSIEPSSSSEAESSSSEESSPSSSSVVPSSSSALQSSSSVAPSSSSVVPSSSSVEPSSSSIAPSSSSVACTASDNNSEYYCSEGTMKEYVFLTDSRDNKIYKTVVIGTQTWMAENLNYDPETGNSTCYNDQTNNCSTYGRLYDWATANIICPNDWHLPSKDEWEVLTKAVGGVSTEGKKLKEMSSWTVNINSKPGTDDYGFSALPGGFGGLDGNTYGLYNIGYWWSTSEIENDNSSAYSRNMEYREDMAIWYSSNKSFLMSVRCVKD